MKLRLKFDNKSYFKRRVLEFYEKQREIHRRNTGLTESENRTMLSSLKIFKNNMDIVFELLGDNSSPLSDLSKKNIDEIIDALESATIDDTISHYYRKPLIFVYDILSLIVVSGTTQKPLTDDWCGGLLGGYLRCGNLAEVTKNRSHEKFMLMSLVSNGRDSIYWDRVEQFLSMVI